MAKGEKRTDESNSLAAGSSARAKASSARRGRKRSTPENGVQAVAAGAKERSRSAGDARPDGSHRDSLVTPRRKNALDLESMPQEVAARFVQVGHKYFFPDGERAFTDRGRRLTTPSENTEVVRSLVAIA